MNLILNTNTKNKSKNRIIKKTEHGNKKDDLFIKIPQSQVFKSNILSIEETTEYCWTNIKVLYHFYNNFDGQKNHPSQDNQQLHSQVENSYDQFAQFTQEVDLALKKVSQQKHIYNKLDYYTCLTDKEIFNLFVAPSIFLGTSLLAIAIPPATVAIPAITGVLASNAIINFKIYFRNLVQKVYLIAGRKQNFYLPPQKINNILIDDLKTNYLSDFDKIKKFIEENKKISEKNSHFKYNLTSAYRYYYKFKKSHNKFRIPDPDSFYKSLYFVRCSKTLQQTLRSQVAYLRLTTIHSLKILRENELFKNFLSNNKIGYSNSFYELNKCHDKEVLEHITKFIKKSLKNNNNDLIPFLAWFVYLTLNSKNVDFSQVNSPSEFNQNSKLKETLKEFEELSHPSDIAKKGLGIFANLPFSRAYLSELNQQSQSVSIGSWLALSMLEGILFLNDNPTLTEKYQKIAAKMNKISSSIYTGQIVAGSAELLGCATGLFSSNILSSLSFSPLFLFSDFTNYKIAEKIDKKEYQRIENLMKDFISFQKTYKMSHAQWQPALDFFKTNQHGKECVHKISHMFYLKIKEINSELLNINQDSQTIIKALSKEGKRSIKNYFLKQTICEKDILTKYTSIVLRLISISKSLEAFEYYLNHFVDTVHSEIDNALKLHMVMMSVKHKDAYKVLLYGSLKDIFEKSTKEYI